MSEPEIARRCTECGASVRQHAMFCPQCGDPIPQASTTTTHAVADTIIDTAPTEAVQMDPGATQPLSAVQPPAQPKVHEDGVRGRLEKIREVSSVVIDQAAYDPSLRFLLVAAGLFLVFLLLLILSKVIG
ncbi:MAG TPA: zinc-ribbon domain-containing protein [Pyrinomonadaceae bacterium]|nr:zinc-ribbon domain-containing protein [Pyrinomonadaceae bacterium]